MEAAEINVIERSGRDILLESVRNFRRGIIRKIGKIFDMLDNFNYTGECRLYCQKYRCLDNQGGIIIVCWMGKKNSFWAKYLIRFSSSFFL